MRKPPEFESHPMPFPEPFTMRGVVRYVVDGDTIDVYVDQGLNHYSYITVRVRGIDAPELYRPADDAERQRAAAARATVESLVMGKPVVIRTYRDRRTFGRYVADVLYWGETGAERSLADELVRLGLADVSVG